MSPQRSHLLRVFIAGLMAALPLLLTITLLWWTFDLINRFVGPSSLVGQAIVRLGLGVTGSELVGYAIGVAILVAGVFGLGLLVEFGFKRGLDAAVHGLLEGIPLVGKLYGLLKRMVDLMGQQRGGDDDGLKSMSAVWCHFGGPAPQAGSDEPSRVAVLALLSTPEPVLIGGRPYLGVIVPTAPVPVGGGLLYLPAEWVTPAEGVGVEALTSIYVSMGVTSGQYLPKAGAAAPASAAQRVVSPD